MKINGHLEFHIPSGAATDGQVKYAIMERLAGGAGGSTLPSDGSAVAGRLAYNTDDNLYYFHNGNEWTPFSTGGDATALQAEVNRIETASGGLFSQNGAGSPLNLEPGDWDNTVLSAAVYIGSSTSLADALLDLDSAIAAAAGVDTLAELTDVTITDSAANEILFTTGANTWVNYTLAEAGIQPLDAGLTDLSSLHTDEGAGIVIASADDTFLTRAIDHDGAGALAGLEVTNGDGVAGNPTVGLDVAGLTQMTTGFVAATDMMIIYDSTAGANKKVDLDDLADAMGAATALGELSDVTDAVTITSGDSYFFTGSTSPDAYTVAAATLGALNNVASGVDSANTEDVLAFDGTKWTAITVATMLADGSILDLSDTPSTMGTSGQVLAVTSASPYTLEFVNFTGTGAAQAYDPTLQAISDYDFATDGGLIIATNNTDSGVAAVNIIADADADKLGIIVTNGDLASTADIEVGLDIDSLTDGGIPGSTETLAIFDGTNNVKVSIGQLADAVIATDIALDDLSDVAASASTNGTGYILVGDATGGWTVDEVTPSAPANFIEAVQDMIGTFIVDGTDTTATYTDGSNTLQIDVDDVFLRNTGDSLDSGVLTVQSGATIAVATGGSLTIADAPTSGTDAANKDYVDSVASGLDLKESVRVASTANIDLATGGLLTVDGVTLVAGDRVLVKDQTTASENGIYVVAAGAWTRASDMVGGSPTDTTGGAHTFVEEGSTYADTGWVISSNGDIDVGTDDMIWTQFTGAGSFTAGLGLDQSGSTIFVKSRELTSATALATDTVAFADLSVSPSGIDGGDRVTTFSDLINDLNIVTNTAGVNPMTADDGIQVFNNVGGSIEAQLELSGLTDLATQSVDIMVFGDSSDSFNTHIKRTVADFITDHNILTGAAGSTLTASDGVILHTDDSIQLDIGALSAVTITSADTLVFNDGDTAGAAGVHAKTTAGDFMSDLDIVNGLSATGIVAVTDNTSGAQVYASRSIAVEGAGAEAGLSVDNGNGVAGNPTLGLDIVNVADGTGVAAGDEFIMYDLSATANVKTAASELATYIQGATTLGSLSDVEVGSVTDGQVLQWNNTAGDWVPVDDDITVTGNSGSYSVALGGAFSIQGNTGITTSVSGSTVLIDRDDMATNDLTDVTAAPTESGQVLVADAASPDTYTPRQIHFVSTQASSTSWTVTHNLGQQYVNVTVVDASNQVIIPQSITMTSASVTTITFNTAVAGKAIITGVAGAATESV